MAVSLGWQMLWQSSLLIALMLVLDRGFGRKLRPGLRYLLWLVVLLKLVLPPSFALPSGLAWWVRPQVETARPHSRAPVVVTYGLAVSESLVETSADEPVRSAPTLLPAGAALAVFTGVSLGFLVAMVWRWRKVTIDTRPQNCCEAPDGLRELLEEACKATGIRRPIGLRIVRSEMSPALFGLVQPVILVPEVLVQRLSLCRLRAVLLHELVHYRRGDVWVNCAQALLQIVYWWHPLVWVANHRLRRVREEAVDEAVMLALRDEAESYAPTLLEVARLALPRRLAGLGLVGILESGGALRQRIERLVDFRSPRRAGMSFASVLCAIVFGLTALPMGRAPAALTQAQQSDDQTPLPLSSGTGSTNATRAEVQALVQEGKLLYEAGKPEEAERKFRQALQEEPREQAAYYYLNLIREARDKQQRPDPRTTSAGRMLIFKKLDSLRFVRAEFDGVPLSEVIKFLSTESRRLDPGGSGINFMLNPGPAESAQAPPLADVSIRLAQPLTDIRMADLLDAIVKTAERPIKYSLEDYAVVFAEKGNEPPALYTRVISVDPTAFEAALRSLGGQPESAGRLDLGKLLREFLASINVDLTPPKTIFWSERSGTLMVRATLQDLDTIETAIQVLKVTPPQLNLRAAFLELSDQEEARFWEGHPDARLSASGVRALQLPGAEAQNQLKAWESSGMAEVLGRSSVTTLSGRQASVEIVELKNVLTWTNSPQPHWITNEVPVGPVLEVLPTVSADRFRVDLELTARMRDLINHEKPGASSPQVDNHGVATAEELNRLLDGASPGAAPAGVTPRVRIRELPITETVWDGRTVIFGGAVENSSSPATSENKRLLVMVTVCLIDPAGNRLHTEGEVEKRLKALGGR
jgi:beta-lactamase regulating signal transducer with metallopeptidase domain